MEAQDNRIASSPKIKAADAKIRREILADTDMLLVCGTVIAGEIEKDKAVRVEIMRMYRKAKLAEMKTKLQNRLLRAGAMLKAVIILVVLLAGSRAVVPMSRLTMGRVQTPSQNDSSCPSSSTYK